VTSVGSGGYTKLVLNVARHGTFDTSNNRYVAVQKGLYHIAFGIRWSDDTNGHIAKLYLNNAATTYTGVVGLGLSSYTYSFHTGAVMELDVDDYVELFATSSGTINTLASSDGWFSTYMMGFMLSTD
jgi:hypothetical protein